jgi:hypothetical protein
VRQLCGIPLGRHADAPAVDHDVVAVGFHRAGIAAMHRIPLEQHRVGLRIGQIVDRDHIDIGAPLLQDRP